MDDEVAIKVEHVSKKYCKSLKRSMLYGMKDIGRNILGMSSHSENLRKDEFWALDGLSFEAKKGETLGIIGPNGSGKTTLLKMLNGIFWPDKGRITIKGKVGALIEIGAGFHPLLTGKENVYINAAILGMTKKEADERFDDIVKLADIGDFIDTPVKYYSSGMFVRLGFAVAVHCEPDILLVDEVLSVGDRNFQQKSIQRMRKLINEGDKTVVFVSHNLLAVRALCKRAIWLNDGKVRAEGPTDYVGSQYERFVDTLLCNDSPQKLVDMDKAFQSGLAKFTNVQLLDKKGESTQAIEFMGYLCIRAWYETKERVDQPNFRFHILSPDNTPVVAPSSLYQGNLVKCLEPGTGYVDCVIEKLPLMPGNYSLNVSLTSCDFLNFYTRTPYNMTFYVSRPTNKKPGIPRFLRDDCQVWVPCRIEYAKENRI